MDVTMKLSVKRIKATAAAAAAVAAAATLTACGSSGSGTISSSSGSSKQITTVTLGIAGVAGVNWLHAIVSDDPSICAPYGVKVKESLLSPTAIAAAMQNGSIDFYAGGNLLLPMAKGIVTDAKVIASLGAVPASLAGIWAGPKYASATQLSGTTMGASSASSPTKLNATPLLAAKGVKSVSFDYLGTTSTLLTALAAGRISATWQLGPLPSVNQQAGDHLLIPQSADPSTLYSLDAWLTGNTNFMSANPSATTGLLECYAHVLQTARSASSSAVAPLQAAVGKYLGNPAYAKQLWPAFPKAAAVQPVNDAKITDLEKSIDSQMTSGTVSKSTVQGLVQNKWMSKVSAVSPG
jgi:hypothetical protein